MITYGGDDDDGVGDNDDDNGNCGHNDNNGNSCEDSVDKKKNGQTSGIRVFQPHHCSFYQIKKTEFLFNPYACSV